MNGKKFTLAAVVMIAAAALAAGCSGGGEEPAHQTEHTGPAAQAKVATVQKKHVTDVYTAVGTVRSDTTVMISAKIMGFVKDLLVSEGDVVKKGQVMVVLDAPEITAKVNQAEAGIEEARQALEEVESGIASAEAGLAAAEAGYELADATYKRFETLVARDSVSRQEFDEVKAKHKMAAAELERAKKGLDAMQSKKKQVEAKIRQAQAMASETRIMLGYAKITAPMDGIVLDRKVEMGSLASPGMPILTMENNTSYRLETEVDESRVRQIKIGDNVKVRIDALGDRALEARVDEIKGTADSMSRSFQVKLSLPAADQIRSGMYGRAEFDMGVAEKIIIPAEAVANKGLVSGVYVVGQDGIATFRIVKTGEPRDGMVEVFSGLAEGDTIAVSGVEAIKDGGKVQVD